MCRVERIIHEGLRNDLGALIRRKVGGAFKKRYYHIRLRTLYRQFVEEYGFKYQYRNKIIVSKAEVIDVIRKFDICSKHNLKKRNPKWCKIIKGKIYARQAKD